VRLDILQRLFFKFIKLIKAICLTIVALCALTKADAADEKGWTIYQVKPKPSAPNIMYISTMGVRFTDGRFNVTQVAKAPDWTLTYFNDKEKTCATESMASWRQRYWSYRDSEVKQQERDRTHSVSPYVTGKTKIIDGMKATQFVQNCANGALEVYVADLPVPPQLNELAGLLSEVPANRLKNDGVLLEKSGLDSAGRINFPMLNSRCKRTDIPAATFDPPRGYRQVSLVDVYGKDAVHSAIPFMK